MLPGSEGQKADKAHRRRPFSSSPPQVLSIAGSDPSGGAGIQADLKTFSSLGCYGMSVLTSLTAQNTQGVTSIHIPPVEFFRAQLQALWEDVEVDAIKLGMLANSEVIIALSQELKRVDLAAPVVLDPVMVSTSGSLLLTHESIKDLIEHLLPHCTLSTPNIPEAQQLLAHSKQAATHSLSSMKANAKMRELNTIETLLRGAKDLCNLTTHGNYAALIKGGHQRMTVIHMQSQLDTLNLAPKETEKDWDIAAELFEGVWENSKVVLIRSNREPYADILRCWSDQSMSDGHGEVVIDVLYDSIQDQYHLFVKAHIQSTATHGTGCTLSSAIASYLASGLSLEKAIYQAIQYVQHSISRGLTGLGQGSGPLNHLCHITPRPVLAPAASGLEQVPLCSRLISHSLPQWNAFTRHSFLQRMSEYNLPAESFIYFLKQDYLFLKNYARVWASGASSFSVGNTFPRIAMFAGIAAEMAAEADNHVRICEPWGITKDDLEYDTVESIATLAYTRFVLDVSRSGDALELLAATGPCLLGYGEAGLWLAKKRELHQSTTSSSANAKGYDQWIDYYSGKDFQEVVRKGIENMEEYAKDDPPSQARIESLQRIWNAATRLEIAMWDEAMNPSLRREILSP